MQISERLRAVAALVTAGGAVADIGTDHAYIPIYLIRTGATARAIAMDVNPGPLARAREHIAQYALETVMEERTADTVLRVTGTLCALGVLATGVCIRSVAAAAAGIWMGALANFPDLR